MTTAQNAREIFDEIGAVRARIRQAEEDIPLLDQEAVALTEEITSTIARGGDPTAKRERRREAHETVADLRASLPKMRENLDALVQERRGKFKALPVLRQQVEGLKASAEHVDTIIADLEEAVARYLTLAQSVHRIGSDLGAGMNDNVSYGTWLRWRIEWAGRDLGFERPHVHVRNKSVAEFTAQVADGVVTGAEGIGRAIGALDEEEKRGKRASR